VGAYSFCFSLSFSLPSSPGDYQVINSIRRNGMFVLVMERVGDLSIQSVFLEEASRTVRANHSVGYRPQRMLQCE
jgi:hypothetical protein